MTDWYVSPTGSGGNAGTFASPWDLASAIGGPNTDGKAQILPGDRVFLRGGTYSGNFWCSLIGATNNRILIRGFPGEWAVIDGSMYFAPPSLPIPTGGTATKSPSHVDFGWALVTQSDPTRGVTGTAPNAAVTTPYPGAVLWQTADTNLRHLVIDNAPGSGISGFSFNASGYIEAYGCIIAHIGVRIDVVPQGSGGGYGTYTANDFTTLEKAYRNCFIYNTCELNFKGYGTTVGVKRMILEDIISFGVSGGTGYLNGNPSNGPMIVPVGTPPTDIFFGGVAGANGWMTQSALRRSWAVSYPAPNFFTRWGAACGDTNQSNIDCEIVDNVIFGFASATWFQKFQFQRNKVIQQRTKVGGIYSDQEEFLIQMNADQIAYPLTNNAQIDNNQYYNTWDDPNSLTTNGFHAFDFPGIGWYAWNNYRTRFPNFDAHSTYSTSLPTGVWTKITKSPYFMFYGDPIAHLGVINWDNLATVPFDVSSALTPGQYFELWHLFDWQRFAHGESVSPMLSGQYDGQMLQIPMNVTKTPREPVGTGQVAPAGPQASLHPFLGFYVLRLVDPFPTVNATNARGGKTYDTGGGVMVYEDDLTHAQRAALGLPLIPDALRATPHFTISLV